MEELLYNYHKLLEETSTDFVRYIHDKITWNNRMIGVVGARGIGKTTLILQHIKQNLNPDEAMYVSADDLYFATNRLLDFASNFEKRGGKWLFIDEIHKYPDWSRELKLMYDYHADLKVVFTGSSVLDIMKGSADLSRRALIYKMQGLSFREYLKMFHGISAGIFDIQQVIEKKVEIPVKHPLPLFEQYLKQGYYPFAKEENFHLILKQAVNQTLEVDIPQFSEMNMATGRKLRQLMVIIAQSVPFKPNFSKIAGMLAAGRNNIADYFLLIEEAGLISQLRTEKGGIRSLGKVDKVYLENTNLLYNLAAENTDIGNVRETFFFNQAKEKYDVITSKVADFEIAGLTFEVGGKNKRQKQIQGTDNAFVVKDNIELAYQNVIPLWHFGFFY
ncbi:MAG: AAA family ATPase [Dysgonamonadaceae bacterium]|jgi:predicted AAA+ superfamily ATPase|nr:AAA family ATPase [Dysgonamonadaceae bacterium]